MQEIKIGKIAVGDKNPCFIIAEAGSNWKVHKNPKDNLELAKQFIKTAKKCGADAVKFQLFRAIKMYSPESGECDYLKWKKPIYDIIKECEMPYEWIPELADYCRKKDIVFLSSPFDEVSADKLEDLVPAFKIASYLITHIPFLKFIAKKGKPLIVSTGASTITDIDNALRAIYSQGNTNVALMQCSAKYPASFDNANLRVIKTLEKIFGVPVGFSDHTKDPIVCPVAAVALGACIIEKHFTLDNKFEGPDQKFAIEPEKLKMMVHSIRSTEKSLGSCKKDVTSEEKELHGFCRSRIYAIKDIARGEKITSDNVAILRSGKLEAGLEPVYWDVIVGKYVTKNIKKYEGILWSHLISE